MSFQYGQHAILNESQQAAFQHHAQELTNEINPRTFLQQLLTEELLHASWELERVRVHSTREYIDSEFRLHAASARASRSWSRAQLQLAKMQRTRK